ncbi:MAG: CMP-binding protein [Clostridiales bacterium]|nr:CMP-binding protein [Clostridiales bacterium]
MKDIYITQLKTDQEILEFFLVKSISVKLGSNRKKYLDLLLGDSSGEITAKKWDISDEEQSSIDKIAEGDIVKVKCTINEWKGMKQMRVSKIRKSSPTDELDIRDFFKAAPEKSEDMYEYLIGIFEDFEDLELKKLCVDLYTENRDKLMYYPAAKKNHHAEYGGLLYHTKRMMMTGDYICTVYKNLNRDLLLCGVAIHDMEKLNEINSDERGVSNGYSFEGQLLGHIVQGIKSIEIKASEIGMSREKIVMLEHMILSHHYEPEFGSPKKPLFPEAEVLHYLDILDARMYDMEDALQSVEPGEFTDGVWTLDYRRLYKAKF